VATNNTKEERRRSRRTPEQTRALMLEAGTELARRHAQDLSEQALATPLAHIRVTDVAKLATELAAGRQPGVGPAQPITTGAIYQLWPSQADYQADLMLHLLGPDAYPEDQDAAAQLLALADGPGTVAEILTAVATEYFERVRDNPLTYVYLTFYVLGRHPRVQSAAHEGYAQLGAGYQGALERLLAREGRAMAGDRTIGDLVVALLAVLEGFALRGRVEPEQADADDPSPRAALTDILSASLLGLWESFTEPQR
jgi:hypothetical protein